MKMQYFRNNRTTGNQPLFSSKASLTIVVVAFVLIGGISILRFLFPNTLAYITTPLWHTANIITSHVGIPIEQKEQVALERDALKTDNEALRNEQIVLTERIRDLEKLLGGRTDPVNQITAEVLVRPPVSPYDAVILDKGSIDGVLVDARVYGPGGIPVGTVIRTTRTTSQVQLYSTSQVVTSGFLGDSKIPLTLYGTGAGTFTAEIQKEATSTVGERIFITSEGSSPIGTVAHINEDPSSPKKRFTVAPYINPFTLTLVSIKVQR
jgi:cell shape-determining protein MreC